MRALEKREKARGRSVRSRSVRVFWDGGWVVGENMGIMHKDKYSHYGHHSFKIATGRGFGQVVVVFCDNA